MSETIKTFDRMIMAARLRELRTDKGIRQNQLAIDLGLSNASISYWENGKQEPTASALFKLAQYFEVSVDYLVGLTD